jgi:hypothetical protein
MLDGFLLFSVLDVWRVLLPLGLSIMCLGTLAFQRLVGETQNTGLSQFLCLLTYRMTTALVCILGVVGIAVPWVLGYSLPESHVAVGPWSYEEICGYVVCLVLLWQLEQQVRQHQIPSGLMQAGVMILFLGAAFLWIGRWDAMANAGQVPGGWVMGSSVQWEWSRLLPKSFHLLFSALVAGGMVVAGLGLLETLTFRSAHGSIDSDSVKSSPDLIRYGVGWMLSGLVPQMLIGPWLFLLLQDRPQLALIEGTSLTSLIFFVSLTTALFALVLLNASFMVPHVKGLVWGGLGNVAMTLALMGIVRYETFGATLFSHNIPFAMPELSGWHVLSVVVLLALLGALLVRWCVWPSTLIFHSTLPTPYLDKT